MFISIEDNVLNRLDIFEQKIFNIANILSKSQLTLVYSENLIHLENDTNWIIGTLEKKRLSLYVIKYEVFYLRKHNLNPPFVCEVPCII